MSQDPIFLTADNITTTHGFFTRIGGLSTGLYNSLNCAWGSKDNLSDVMTNRALVVQSLGNRISDLLSAAQVHSNRVHIVDQVWTRERSPEVDALVTNKPGIALGILTADCAPSCFTIVKTALSGPHTPDGKEPLAVCWKIPFKP